VVQDSKHAGKCFEVLFYSVAWDKLADQNDPLISCGKVLMAGIQKFCDELSTRRWYRAVGASNDVRSDDIRPLCYPMFGEYDYFVIRPDYSARAHYYSWPPQIESSSKVQTHHLKRYVYQASESLLPDCDFDSVSKRLNDHMSNGHQRCFCFSQVEIGNPGSGNSPDKILNQSRIPDGVSLLQVFESSAWDDYAALWLLDDGLESFGRVLKYMVQMSKERHFARSVSHLMYEPPSSHEVDQSNDRGTSLTVPLKARTSITLPSRQHDVLFLIEKVYSKYQGDLEFRIRLASGLFDIDIEWDPVYSHDHMVMREVTSELMKEGAIEYCSTIFLLPSRTED